MLVHPFTYVCRRDKELFDLLVYRWVMYEVPFVGFADRAERDCLGITSGAQIRTRPDGFFPWSGWDSAMSKLAGWASMVADPNLSDSDYVLHVDSDGYFWDYDIFTTFEGYDFIGFPHSEYKYIQGLGKSWSWLSGCFQAARAGKVREVVAMSYTQLEKCRREMLEAQLSHNEDVVMSYLFAKCEAKENRLDTSEWMECDIEKAFRGEIQPHSFSHMQFGPGTFLGEHIEGKWEIPAVLAKRKKGLL